MLIAILASFVAFLDGAVVNVALPAIQQAFGGGLGASQWIVDSYLLTLGSFILIAGSVSDLYGRQKVLYLGLIGFGITSLLCAFAPSNTFLIVSRALQGLAGALLVPSSLALVATYISGNQFSKAIGSWTAWTGIAFIIGPLVGGLLTDHLSWRWIFAINVFPIALTLLLLKKLPIEEKPHHGATIDTLGAALCALGLGGFVFGMIEQPRLGWEHPLVYVSLVAGTLSLVAFFWHERTTTHPMLPLTLFKARNFSNGNLATFVIYGGLTAATFLITLYLQQVAQYSALRAGTSLLPITIILFLLSSRIGRLSDRFGPRAFMAIGPCIGGAGLLLMSFTMSPSANYITEVLPGVLLLGLGLAITVTPLTAAILSDIEASRSGIASAINNAVARIAGLLAVAAIGTILASSFTHTITDAQVPKEIADKIKNQTLQTSIPEEVDDADIRIYDLKNLLERAATESFTDGLSTAGGLLIAGGIISALGIRNKKQPA